MQRFQKPTWLLTLILALTAAWYMAPLNAQDAQPGGIADAATEEADPFKVPDGKAEELLDYIRQLRRRRPEGKSRTELIANYKKIQNTLITASDRLFETAQLDKDSALQFAAVAVQVKTRALQTLQQLGDESATGRLKEYAAALVKDEREEIADIGKELEMQMKFEFPLDADKDAVKKVAAELKSEFAEGEIDPKSVGLIMQALMRFEQSGNHEIAADLNQYFGERLASSSEERIASLSERLKGTARRLNLPGKTMDLAGSFLGGGELDWANYRGKVVLVDYWATWCGPCIQELPNVLENYKKYHNKGFDVVAISLDTDREKVEKFFEDRELPWKTLFSDDPETNGWQHPMATKYGVGGIPTVILVDREGKVVSLNARGPELGRLLADLIGSGDKEGSEEGS